MLLPAAGMNTTLRTPKELLSASSNLEGVAHGMISTVNASTTATDLPSQTAYVLVLAARDAAPVPNYVPQPVQLQLVAPDVTPPTFTGACCLGLTRQLPYFFCTLPSFECFALCYICSNAM
jgi:hypothetical protein